MNTNIDIIYCYRNRDLQRVKNSLDSLALQTVKEFNVIFIDYGSDDSIAEQVKDLCSKYSFCSYIYIDSQGKMWNRADALNYGFYFSKSDYVFTSDIDMLFYSDFIKDVSLDLEGNTAKFYSVGYLSEADSKNINVNELTKLNYTKSEDFALGMVLLPRKMVLHINGYNSFYAVWGQEDNDIKYRIEDAGFATKFMKEKTQLLHQYHPISNADSNSIPVGWLQFIKDYYENFKREKIAFFGIDAIATPIERPAKVIFMKTDGFKSLDYRKLFIRHKLINDVFILEPSKSISYSFDLNKNVMTKSKVYEFAKMLSKLFMFLNIPLEVQSKYKEQYIDKNEVRNEIYFALKSLEQFIQDYYLCIEDHSIKLVIVRK